MKNMTILIGGQKGGVGKTTNAVELAIMRKREGRDVVLVDTDSQQNAVKWAKRRADIEGIDVRVPVFHFADRGRSLADAIRDLQSRCQDIVIDVAGFKSEEFMSALTVADRLISPIRSSQFDLDTMAEVDNFVGTMRIANPMLDATWFSTMVTTHATARLDAVREAHDALSDMKNLRPLKAVIYSRRGFEMVARGLVLSELPKSESRDKGIFELQQLYKEAWQPCDEIFTTPEKEIQ